MYTGLLTHVVSLIERTAKTVEPKEDIFDDSMNAVFNPRLYQKTLAERRKRENIKNNLILGVTAVAVAAELYQAGKSHGRIRNRK